MVVQSRPAQPVRPRQTPRICLMPRIRVRPSVVAVPQVASVFAALVAAAAGPGVAEAFILSTVDPDPWLVTASGNRPGNGAPAAITWSLVPDGTIVANSPNPSAPSNLISFLNTNFGGDPTQPDLTLQPWFSLFEESFSRWSELSGVFYAYEPRDDGVLHPSADGALGVRGDIRIGGIDIDGPSGTLAFNYLPPSGSDLVIDTGDVAFFTNAANNFRNFRNTVTHEIGHGFGLLHVESPSVLLMEPISNSSIDGPQLDEVRGVQYFFGDANERSNGGLGNATAALATPLGTVGFGPGGGRSVGADANVPTQAISPAATDFVSISNLADIDFYSFSLTGPALLTATLTPRGGTFSQASENNTPALFNATARSNLSLTLLAADGITPLAAADAGAAGSPETIRDLVIPAAGSYFARITGGDDTIQLYELELTALAPSPADFDLDGDVDGGDLAVWETGFAMSAVATRANGDATGDGQVRGADFLTWQREFGANVLSHPAQTAVPEPASSVLGVLAASAMLTAAQRLRR